MALAAFPMGIVTPALWIRDIGAVFRSVLDLRLDVMNARG